MEEKVTFQVKGRKLQFSHLDKVLFPGTGFTKAHALNYYIRASDYILPHLHDRPLTLKLYVNGISAPAQYIKDAPTHAPGWVKRAPVWRKSGESQIRFLLLNDLPSLAWSVNLNNLEMHVFLARAPQIERPNSMLFDLDPGEPATILDCAEIALRLRGTLAELGLQCFIKASGSKGLHVHVPLNTPVTYEQTLAFSREIGRELQRAEPRRVVLEMSKSSRRGKVFVDVTQNVSYKSTACVYSLRTRADGPFVSTPLTWDEVAAGLASGDSARFFFRPDPVLERCEKMGDLFAPVLEMKQKLPRKTQPARGRKKQSAKSRDGSAPVTAPESVRPAKLKAYHAKRDFTQTAEPPGQSPSGVRAFAGSDAHKELSFVIQKHAASHLHYDFRLEMEGVLRSWAVPKGPPLLQGERRLAMHVEDHPLDYASFEGTIPKGQYGGGTVMVWDFGTYTVKDGHPVRGYHMGKLHLEIHGKKLKGEWALVRGRQADDPARQPWLLIKVGANARPISRKKDDQSAVTGRTMEQIAAENTAVWNSNREG